MSWFFKIINGIAEGFWDLLPEGLKPVWLAIPDHIIIILVAAIGLIAGAFTVSKLWVRIVMYSVGGFLVLYLIAQALNYP